MTRPSVLVLGLLALALPVLVPGTASAHPPAAATTYRWVDPPQDPDRPVRPAQGRRAEVGPEILASGAVDVWTPDLQAVLTMTVPPDAGTPVEVALTPVAATDLPPVPDMLPNGNAYRVELTGNTWTPTSAALRLVTPFPATTAWRLEGHQWTDLDVTPGPDGRIRAPVGDGDIVLAAAASTDGHGSWWAAFSHDPVRPWLAAAGLALGAVGLRTARRTRRLPGHRRSPPSTGSEPGSGRYGEPT